MIHTLRCPSCGAPVDYDERGERDTVRCPFCESTVMLPRRERRAVEQPPAVEYKSNNTSVIAGVIVAFVAVIVTGLVAFYALHSYYSASTNVKRPVSSPNVRINLPLKNTSEGEAQPNLSFGSEGTGAGYFKDARSIAVDAEGHIYVGEYIGGRVQVFDSTGKFLTQWTVDAKMPLRGMAADRRGTVYVVQKGKITRHEGMTGRTQGDVAYSGRSGFDDVAVTAEGGLVAFSSDAHDDIIRFNSSGEVTKVIRSAISGQTDRSELTIRVATDGLGQIYALGAFNDAVFKFSPDGRFLTQFGSAGDEPGQFRAPQAIAVDNQGRVYVSDIKGVQVFDANGRYLNFMKVKGVAFGMVFNDHNELFIAARTQVFKFALNKQ
ncbi:MAG: hypothetical protein LC754_01370 [Acidobacteria bacterium]|nr:hypothetical protein [Acidobacteriota bacterium]